MMVVGMNQTSIVVMEGCRCIWRCALLVCFKILHVALESHALVLGILPQGWGHVIRITSPNPSELANVLSTNPNVTIIFITWSM